MRVGKLLSVLFILFMMFPGHIRAQQPTASKPGTRILLGASGGMVYDNITASVTLGLEVPLRRFEFDAQEIFSPYENHTAVGVGTANSVRGMGILWATKSFGLTGGIKQSEYSATIHKSAYDVMPGVVIRKALGGIPSRFEINYVRQVDNRFVNGMEPNRLQGMRFAMTTRMGCSGKVCYRLEWEMEAGRVHLQGNPNCDGTLPGPVTCANRYATSGGAKVGFSIEFPRHRGIAGDDFEHQAF